MPEAGRRRAVICLVCELRKAKARSLCDACYNRLRYHGVLRIGRHQRWGKNGMRCRVCLRKHHAGGLCKRHYCAERRATGAAIEPLRRGCEKMQD